MHVPGNGAAGRGNGQNPSLILGVRREHVKEISDFPHLILFEIKLNSVENCGHTP